MIYEILITKKWQETEYTTLNQTCYETSDGRTGEPTYSVDVKFKEHENNLQWKDERTFTDSSEVMAFINELVTSIDLEDSSNFKFIVDLRKVYETIYIN